MSCRRRPPYRPGHGWISGVAFPSTLASIRPASRGFTSVRCCSSPPASSPRALAVPRSCFWLTVASNRPCRGLAPPIDHSCPTHSGSASLPRCHVGSVGHPRSWGRYFLGKGRTCLGPGADPCGIRRHRRSGDDGPRILGTHGRVGGRRCTRCTSPEVANGCKMCTEPCWEGQKW